MTLQTGAAAAKEDEFAAWNAAFAFAASSNDVRAKKTALHVFALNPCHPEHRKQLSALLEDPGVKIRLGQRKITFRQPKTLGLVLGRERVSLSNWDRLPGPESAQTQPLMRDLGAISLSQVRKIRLSCANPVHGKLRSVDKDKNRDILEGLLDIELEAGDMQQTILLLGRDPEPDSVSVIKVDHYALEDNGKRAAQPMGSFVTLFITPHDPFAGVKCE
jgi:hypothetical protein